MNLEIKLAEEDQILLRKFTDTSRLSNLSLAVLQLKGPGPVAKKKKRRVVALYSFVFSDGPNPTEARVAVAQGGGIKIIRYTYLVATLLIYIVSGMSSFSKKDAHFSPFVCSFRRQL